MDLGSWADSAPPPAKKRRASPRGGRQLLERSLEEVRARVAAGQSWEGAEPRHLVALYAVLHRKVYGTAPLELDGKIVLGAVSAARRMVEEAFGGSVTEAVEYLRWTWARENRRWRRSEGDARRIGWRLQFVSRSLITDYRAARAQRGGTG